MAKRKPSVQKICPKCSLPFATSDGDKFCPDCTKVVKEELSTSGYLTPYPRPTFIKPDNINHGDREPSPWQENAIRGLEGD